ncbi:hypothetical protein GSI_01962 [Ganoderma sinense ZZ0214-1]|uniref:Uncharacterized protein n=1 Tax=Ganoderma sinense ZZ0214-1 TaxID=1077348 RepID=A0A2G8SRA5_9APHY|nr:hypothetical protein GSI_01962 [Ganoderma sinense ZZ0214-1]
MDSKSLAEQEKDIRDLLRRAERTPVKTSALRRDTLKRLIDLAHSPHPSLKIIAATHLKLFVRDFSDLEDDAINAVYDLCEDPVAAVRIKGYAAIVDVSREQSKWIKRNVDVLVQLLQSDEPEEVTFVKRALTQHLDMDPIVTLGVLCDQVIPSDEPVDDEELAIRDRIRSLVLAFLAGEAKRPLIDRHANCLESPAEGVLVSGLFKAITKLAPNNVDFVVKDIIVSLPSFTPYSSRGKELLDILLTQVRALLKSEIPFDAGLGLFTSLHYYLDLASFVTVERQLVHPSHLLSFYYAVLVEGLLDLTHLSEGEQSNVICHIARTLAACEDVGEGAPSSAPAADLGGTSDNVSGSGDEASRHFSDVCVMLLHSFADMTLEDQRPWRACLILVQAIVHRKRDGCWQTPQAISSALERIKILHAQKASVETMAVQEQVHSLIRSLVQPVKPPVSSIMAPATEFSPSAAFVCDSSGKRP